MSHAIPPKLIVLDHYLWAGVRQCPRHFLIHRFNQSKFLPPRLLSLLPHLVASIRVVDLAFGWDEEILPTGLVSIDVSAVKYGLDEIRPAPIQLFDRIDHLNAHIDRPEPICELLQTLVKLLFLLLVISIFSLLLLLLFLWLVILLLVKWGIWLNSDLSFGKDGSNVRSRNSLIFLAGLLHDTSCYM